LAADAFKGSNSRSSRQGLHRRKRSPHSPYTRVRLLSTSPAHSAWTLPCPWSSPKLMPMRSATINGHACLVSLLAKQRDAKTAPPLLVWRNQAMQNTVTTFWKTRPAEGVCCWDQQFRKDGSASPR